MFQKLPQYIDDLRELDPKGYFHLELTDRDQFGRVFVALGALRSCLSAS